MVKQILIKKQTDFKIENQQQFLVVWEKTSVDGVLSVQANN